MKRIAPSLGILLAGSLAFGQQAEVGKALQQGVGAYLWLCLLGGFAALLTPCVFPMIPVTVSYFSKREHGALAGATAYAIGIVSAFAIIGILATAAFGATGIQNFAAGPWFNIALAAIFVLLALNLFGVYELQPPLWLSNRLNNASRKGGIVGPYMMGVTFSITSFTCTMPIVASLLTASVNGAKLMPTIGMATYGFAFALPFFALALFPASLNKMPKAGNWLSSVKPVLGFLELAAAMKFLSNADLAWTLGILTRPVMLAIWTGMTVLLGLYLLGLPKAFLAGGIGRKGFALLTFMAAGLLAVRFSGPREDFFESYLPREPYPTAKQQATAVIATGPILASDFKDALAKAKETGRPIFVDFTGVNCTNCRWMEDNIFPKAVVKAELDKTIHVTLYTDRPNPDDHENQKLQTALAENNALPTYILVSSDGKTVINKLEGAEPKPEKFAEFLKVATNHRSVP